MASIINAETPAEGQRMTWAEVSKIHKIRNGIYHRNGLLISLLTDFGRINPCYPDHHGEGGDTILYTGSGRRGDQKLNAANRAMLDAIDSCNIVPLFNKLSIGVWEFTGLWLVTEGKFVFDESRNRMIWNFTLRPATALITDPHDFRFPNTKRDPS
ncbi:MAG: YDG/SRA domain-containing protein [Acidobacteria bacterium]|nr:YDG/SRA domain-containing protein [Acidobacteriota bacterium]MCA1608517.1 YDG/SRA domain-containing protein [Acidobacteriota bacterium]